MSGRPHCRLVLIICAAAAFLIRVEPGLAAPIFEMDPASSALSSEPRFSEGAIVDLTAARDCAALDGTEIPPFGDVDSEGPRSAADSAPCVSRDREADPGCWFDAGPGDPSVFYRIDPSGDVKIGPSVMAAPPLVGESKSQRLAFGWVRGEVGNCAVAVTLSPPPGMAGFVIEEPGLNAVVPEPASASLTLLGLLAFGFLKRLGRRKG